MNERIRNQGYLAEARQEARSLRLRIESTRNSIREKLDPFADIDTIDDATVAELAIQLGTALADYREICARITALKNALGER